MHKTTVLGTEVIFVDPDVERWGLRNILGMLSLFRSGTD